MWSRLPLPALIPTWFLGLGLASDADPALARKIIVMYDVGDLIVWQLPLGWLAGMYTGSGKSVNEHATRWKMWTTYPLEVCFCSLLVRWHKEVIQFFVFRSWIYLNACRVGFLCMSYREGVRWEQAPWRFALTVTALWHKLWSWSRSCNKLPGFPSS